MWWPSSGAWGWARVAGPAALVLIVLAGCGDSSGGGSPAAPSASLAGPQWVLDTGTLGVSGAAKVTATLRFDTTGRVTGSDGCNTLSGPYTTDGDAIRFGPLAGTRRFCPPPAGEVATRVLRGLERARSYRATAARLELRDAGGTLLLAYRASTPGVTGRWKAISILYGDAIHSVITGTAPTAAFGADGHVSGSGGCNSFGGDYTVGGDTLRIGALVSTQMACAEPAGVDEQEHGYLTALQSARRFEQAGDTLTIFDAQGRMAVTLHRAGSTP